MNNLVSYTISLWENELVTEDGITYLKENKICDIGSSDYSLPSDAVEPILTLKDNGEMDFKFTLYTNYYDIDTQENIENPYLKYIIAERRVKLCRDDEWYDFNITQINYDSSGKKVTIECENAFAAELGHTGYGLEFNTELENNLGTVFDLGKEITANSDWKILDEGGVALCTDESECVRPAAFLEPHINTPLYQGQVIASFDAYQTLHTDTKYHFNYDSGTTTYIKIIDKCVLEGAKPFQFYLNTTHYSIDVTYEKIGDYYVPYIDSGKTQLIKPSSIHYTDEYGIYYTSKIASDLIQEIQKEYLYRARIKREFTAYETLKQSVTKTFSPGTSSSNFIYIFSSCLTNATSPLQFLSFDNDARETYIEKNDVITDCINYSVNVTYSDVDSKGIYTPKIDGLEIVDEIYLEPKLRGQRYVSTALSQYDEVVDKYINRYKLLSVPTGAPDTWAAGDEIRGYYEVEYLTPNVNKNLITNPNNFIKASGWTPIRVTGGSTTKNDDATVTAIKITDPLTSEAKTYSGLDLTFKNSNTYFFNSGFNDSKEYIDGISGGDYYVIKAEIYKYNSTTYAYDFCTPTPIRCTLNQYTIESNGYYTKGLTLLDFKSPAASSWKTGNNYLKWLPTMTKPRFLYKYEESTGIYHQIDTATQTISSSETYYYVGTQYSYIVVSAQGGTLSHKTLFESDSKFGFFITTEGEGTYYIKDFEIFTFIPKEDGATSYIDHQPFLPDELKPTKISNKYYFYKYDEDIYYKEQIQFYTADSLLSNFEQKYSDNCEKRRSITISKSNRYNILSTICENFECWLKIYVAHESDGHIAVTNRYYYEQLTSTEISRINAAASGRGIYYEWNKTNRVYDAFNADVQHEFAVTSSDKTAINAKGTGVYYYRTTSGGPLIPWDVAVDGKLEEAINYIDYRYGLDIHTNYFRRSIVKQQEKYLIFTSNIGKPNYAGFKYGVNLNKIVRNIKSDSVVTKLYVEENSNEFADNGFCTISNASSNTSGETYIYNFNHYINRQFINGEECTADISNMNKQLKDYNNEISQYTDELLQAEDQLSDLGANKTTYSTAYDAAQEEVATQDDNLYYLTKQRYEYLIDHPSYVQQCSTTVQNLVATVSRLKSTVESYASLVEDYTNQYNIWLNRATDLQTKLDDLTTAKNTVIQAFEQKYANYIKEGTWESEDYDNAELYYLDACNVSEDSAYPKVSYTLDVIDVAGLEDYSNYKFSIGDCTYIEDTELFGYCLDGVTPLQKDVAITQIVYYLNNPKNNKITISTFKDAFNDLFSRFQAATQKLEYKEVAYDRAASAINNVSGVTSDLLQKSFENNNIVISQSGNQSVVWGAETGIQLTALDTPNNVIRLIGQGVFLSNDGGLNWQSALTAGGFNASLLSSGVIHTSNISIVDDNDQSSFVWDRHGINAYSYTADTAGNIITQEAKFIRFDRFGLYGVDGTTVFQPTSETDILNNKYVDFSLTWSGFRIRTHHEETIDGEYVWGGGISITSDDDIQVKDGKNTTRIKMGLLGITDLKAKYGLELYDSSGHAMLKAQDDGILWLATRMDVYNPNSSATYKGRASLGYSGGYEGWALNPRTNLRVPRVPNSILDPINGDKTPFQRVFHINDSSTGVTLVKAKLLQTIQPYQSMEQSYYQTIVPSGVTPGTGEISLEYIYIVASHLTGRVQAMQFYIFDDETAAEYLTSSEGIPDTEPMYTYYVSYSDSQKEGSYYLPCLEDTTTPIVNTITEFALEGLLYSNPYKFEIYDDGSYRSPTFSVQSDGTVSLDIQTGILYAPTFKLASDYSLIDISLKSDNNSVGLKVYSMEPSVSATEKFLRLELAVTPSTDDEATATGINPYLHMVPNYDAQNPSLWSEDEQKSKQGLIKMFPNGIWIGNATQIDDVTFNPTSLTEGIFISFSGTEVTKATAKIYNGIQSAEIATGVTPAVFG